MNAHLRQPITDVPNDVLLTRWAPVFVALFLVLALALRFVPYSDDRGNFDPFWTVVILVLFALPASAQAAFFPAEVVEWMRGLPFFYEDDHAIYVHAGIKRTSKKAGEKAECSPTFVIS